ncbi:hypothetical protein ACFQ51_04370 [Streptomyces kaempferi]
MVEHAFLPRPCNAGQRHAPDRLTRLQPSVHRAARLVRRPGYGGTAGGLRGRRDGQGLSQRLGPRVVDGRAQQVQQLDEFGCQPIGVGGFGHHRRPQRPAVEQHQQIDGVLGVERALEPLLGHRQQIRQDLSGRQLRPYGYGGEVPGERRRAQLHPNLLLHQRVGGGPEDGEHDVRAPGGDEQRQFRGNAAQRAQRDGGAPQLFLVGCDEVEVAHRAPDAGRIVVGEERAFDGPYSRAVRERCPQLGIPGRAGAGPFQQVPAAGRGLGAFTDGQRDDQLGERAGGLLGAAYQTVRLLVPGDVEQPVQQIQVEWRDGHGRRSPFTVAASSPARVVQ